MSEPSPPTPLDCRECGARLLVEPDRRTVTCPYCASPSVVERPPTPDRPVPVFCLGFTVERGEAEAAARRWRRGRLFARGDFRRAPLADLQGIYLPAYLYGAQVHADYAAEIGENYTEVYVTTDSKGRTVTRTRTRTEWRSLQGPYAAWLQDVLVSASRGLPNAALERMEPYDLRLLARYQPGLVAGWTAEEPSLGRSECVEAARGEATAQLGRALAAFLPGDSHRNLRFQVRFVHEVTDPVLVPVWTLAVRYAAHRPPARILVNGQTGKTWGEAPLSVVRVVAAALGGLAAAALALWAAGVVP